MPAPVPKRYKWLLKAVPYIVVGAESLYDLVTQAGTPQEVQWRYVTAVFSRATPSGTVEDNAQFGLNITNITGGNIDTTWTAADYTTVEAHLTELFVTLNPFISSTHTLKEFRWYTRSFNPDLPIGQPVTTPDPSTGKPYKRFARTGPPVHVTVKNLIGGSASVASAYQVALTVTFKTPGPRHWGRVYVPGVTSGMLGNNTGRFSVGNVTTIANAWAEFLDDLQGSEFQLAVPATQHEGKFATALNSAVDIQVDDIPDVIRRRRPKQAKERVIGVPSP